MTFVGCSVPERFVNSLFEVFDGGNFVLSSSRNIEEDFTRMRIYLEDAAQADEAKSCLSAAMEIVGADAAIEVGEIQDEDWKFAYRRHFKTEEVGRRLVMVPSWEPIPEGDRLPIVLDPGMAFGTGKHETTRACLEYIDALADELKTAETPRSFLDMGCGSGILSIAAAKLGFAPVSGFDVDPVAVEASEENAARNGVATSFRHFALGRKAGGEAAHGRFDLVAANILGPLLMRFADEIVGYVGGRLIVSGILAELYPEVLETFASKGLREVSRKTMGEWTTGLLSVD